MAGKLEYFDTHCHLAEPALAADLAASLQRARAAGLAHALVCSTHPAQYPAVCALCARERLSAALGAFDLAGDFARTPEATLAELEAALDRGPLPAALGEVGIDRRHLEAGLGRAAEIVFEGVVAMAVQHDLPLSVHGRGALPLAAAVLRRQPARSALRGVIHAFNGSLEQARIFLALGFKLGFGTVLLNPAARRIAAVLRALGPDDYVLETDAPFMLSAAARSRSPARTEPVDIALVAQAAAAIRGEPLEKTACDAAKNAARLFLRPSMASP